MIPIKEVEIKLLIDQDKGPQIFSDLSELLQIGKFEFGIKNNNNIKDIYFDTPDYIFGKNNAYLRIRCINAKRRITFRIENHSKSKKPIINEITHALNDVGIMHIFNNIGKTNIAKLTPDFSEVLFYDLIKSSGLQRITSAIINRSIRTVFLNNNKIATINMDQFKYIDIENNFFEIEIDIYEKNYQRFGEDLKLLLLQNYKPSLKQNQLSKYGKWLLLNCIIVS